MTKEYSSKKDPTISKKKSKKTSEKGIGLFDHVKHIKSIRDPNYYKNLTDLDKKTFSHFMILKCLSMNPDILDEISIVFKYFDKIDSEQFYKLLIGIIPIDRKFYPWVKSKNKKKKFDKNLIGLLTKYFEVSNDEASDYTTLLYETENGRKELKTLCENFGLSEKEINKILTVDEEEI